MLLPRRKFLFGLGTFAIVPVANLMPVRAFEALVAAPNITAIEVLARQEAWFAEGRIFTDAFLEAVIKPLLDKFPPNQVFIEHSNETIHGDLII